MNDNKLFNMTAKVFNGVAGTDRIIVDDVCFYRDRISNKDFVTQNIVNWLDEKQSSITNENESKKAEIVTSIGSAVTKSAYIGIEKDGYRLYESPDAMTFHIENESHLVKRAEEAVGIITDIATAAADRHYDREQWLKDFCKDEIAEKNRLKYEMKNGMGSDRDVLSQEYKSALNALDQKRLIGKEHPDYKAMSTESAKENLSAYFTDVNNVEYNPGRLSGGAGDFDVVFSLACNITEKQKKLINLEEVKQSVEQARPENVIFTSVSAKWGKEAAGWEDEPKGNRPDNGNEYLIMQVHAKTPVSMPADDMNMLSEVMGYFAKDTIQKSISADKFIPRQVWVAEDTPYHLYQYQNDGHDLYMTEEPVKGFAMIAPDFFEAPDEVIRVPMEYIRQEVRIKEGCDPLLMPEIEEHIKNGGRLFSMGDVRDDVMFVVAGDISDEVTNITPAQYILIDELEFVNIEMAEQEFAAAMADTSAGNETEMSM